MKNRECIIEQYRDGKSVHGRATSSSFALSTAIDFLSSKLE
jgi:hypothetical protein